MDADENDDVSEVNDNDQSGWTLDHIVYVVMKEELRLIRAKYGVVEEIALHRLEAGEVPSQGRAVEIALFIVAFECGLQLPMALILHRFFGVVCIHLF